MESSPTLRIKESGGANPTEETEATEAIYKYRPTHLCTTSPTCVSKQYKASMAKRAVQMGEWAETGAKP